MKPFFSVLTLFALTLTASVSFADSCPDRDSQQAVGYNLAMANAKDALPGVQNLQTTITNEKFHQLGKWRKAYDRDQADYLSFDIIIGTPEAGWPGAYSPAVAYTVTVDTDCKSTTQLDYTNE
jgi:hypothetical protein